MLKNNKYKNMKFEHLVKLCHVVAAFCTFSAFIVSAYIGSPAAPWELMTFLWILLSWTNYSELTRLKNKNKA